MKTSSFMSGLRRMNRQVSWAVISAMFFALASVADDVRLTNSPDPEIFEFLGEWESAQGEWLDPISFEDPIFSEETTQSVGQDNE